MKDFLRDMWIAYRDWIVNGLFLTGGIVAGWLCLPQLTHINVGAKLFILAVLAMIAHQRLTKGRKMNKRKLKQAGELAYEFCWCGIRWIIVAALLLMMAGDMAGIVLKVFRHIGH